MNPWLEEKIINKFPSSRENNSREIVRNKVKTFIRTGHPKVGREVEQLLPELDLDIDSYLDHNHTDQAGDLRGHFYE